MIIIACQTWHITGGKSRDVVLVIDDRRRERRAIVRSHARQRSNLWVPQMLPTTALMCSIRKAEGMLPHTIDHNKGGLLYRAAAAAFFLSDFSCPYFILFPTSFVSNSWYTCCISIINLLGCLFELCRLEIYVQHEHDSQYAMVLASLLDKPKESCWKVNSRYHSGYQMS